MTKHRPKRTVWDRGKQEPHPETERAKLVRNIGSSRVATIQEAANYLKVNRTMIEKFIERGVLEVIPTEGRTRLISMEQMRGLLRPVNSLNKRLYLLDQITAEINEKIKKKQEQLKKLKANEDDNRN